jgi:hypothetical protein
MKTVDPDEMTETMNHLHTIRAHMLYYSSLLADFQKAVTFVKETRNPAIGDVKNDDQIRKTMKRECDHILTEITRIEKDCQMQDERLENASNLVCVFTASFASPLITLLPGQRSPEHL